MHPDEISKIKKLAAGDPAKEARLVPAACALVKCYAEYAVDSLAYQQFKQLAQTGASEALAGERQLLASQSGLFGYSTSGYLSDTNKDAAWRINNTYQIDTRALGAAQAILGGVGVAASVVTAPVSCATGIGCVANAVVGTTSLDATYAGAKQVVSGRPEGTFLNRGLQGFGWSPEMAGLFEAGIGIGSAATAGAVVSAISVARPAVTVLGVSRVGSSDLSFGELRALKTAGLFRMEIAQQLELNRDIYIFRGTSQGWAGSPGAQTIAVSASLDPYIATVFALEARGQARQAVLQFGSRSEIGTFTRANWFAVQEREVGVLTNAQGFAARAPNTISVDQARTILGEMGMPTLPRSILNSSDRSLLLDAAPKMTPQQIAEFLRRTKN